MTAIASNASRLPPRGRGWPHVEGVSEDEGDALACAEVREPVPGEHAPDRNDEVVAVTLL